MKKIPIVIIGGGTGTSVLLHGLRKYPVDPTVVVSTADSGGSSGLLRKELGIHPVGDIRQCLLPLSDLSFEEKALWNHRFTKGHLQGHSMGNLLIAALADMSGSVEKALTIAKRIWKIRGTILPMTEKPTTLCVRYADGSVVCDEHAIDEPEQLHGDIHSAYLKEKTAVYHKVTSALRQARCIIFAPGDLYTSTLPLLLTTGVHQALRVSRAPIVYVANLMTSRGETDGFTLSRLVGTLDQYLGKRSIDTVIVNSTRIAPSALSRYKASGEVPLPFDREAHILRKKTIIARALLHAGEHSFVKGDVLRRSFIRHDPAKLARVIMEIINTVK